MYDLQDEKDGKRLRGRLVGNGVSKGTETRMSSVHVPNVTLPTCLKQTTGWEMWTESGVSKMSSDYGGP